MLNEALPSVFQANYEILRKSKWRFKHEKQSRYPNTVRAACQFALTAKHCGKGGRQSKKESLKTMLFQIAASFRELSTARI